MLAEAARVLKDTAEAGGCEPETTLPLHVSVSMRPFASQGSLSFLQFSSSSRSGAGQRRVTDPG